MTRVVQPKKQSQGKGRSTPSSASDRLERLREREREIGELVHATAQVDRIAALEKEIRYLKAFSTVHKARNPWWIVMQVRYVIRAIVKRYLTKK
jgi:hypothetical protein